MKKKIINLACFCSALLLFAGCSKEDAPEPMLPTQFLELKADVDYESVKLGVSVVADKMLDGAERGFVISERTMPTVDDQKIVAQKEETSYTALVQKLKEKTTYYVRAYLKKSETEYVYSAEISFSTLVLADKEKILVEGGSFDMGGNAEPDQQPIHKVTLKGFKIDAKEVTYAKYADFMNKVKTDPRGVKIPSNIERWIYLTGETCGIKLEGETYVVKEGKENLPVGWIRYPGAEAYAQWVGGRVPSEAEWEYAALGGQKSKNYTFAGSNNLDEVGWFLENSNEKVHPVGQKLPNELGLYDMSGNVGEWCVDSYHGEETGYNGAPNDGSAWTVPEGRGHIIRGGSFQSEKDDCTSKYRSYNNWFYSGDNVGFRVVYDIEKK